MSRWQRDIKRRARLLTKLQKAGVIHRREEVESLSNWGKRFGAVCKLRAQRNQGGEGACQ